MAHPDEKIIPILESIISILESIGSYVVKIIEWLDPIYQNHDAPAGLALIIVFIGLAVILVELVKFYGQKRKINAAKKIILKHVGSDKASILNNFYNKLDSISKDLKDNSIIGNTWIEYRERMIRPEDGQRIYISIRPFEYFNIHDTHLEHVYLQRFWPGFFVALGLIFTFIGLILALDDARSALGREVAIESAVESLQNLLSTAGAKFYTSLAGLFTSIVVVFFARGFNRKKNIAFKEFCELIEECTVYQPDVEIYIKSEKTFREQLEQLKLFNDTLVTKLADKLNEDLPRYLSEAIKPLVEKLNDASGHLQNQGEDRLEQISKDVQETFAQRVDTQITGLTSQLNAISNSLTTAVQQINESSGNMKGGIADASQDLKETVSGLADMLKESGTTAGSSVNTAMNDMKTILADISSTFKNANEDFSNESKELLTHAAEETNSQTDIARQAITNSSETITRGLMQLNESMTDGFNELHQSIRNLNTSVSTTSGQMTTYTSSLQDVNEKVKDTGSSLMHATQTASQIAQPLKDILAETAQITRTIKDGEKAIADSIAVSQEIVQQLSQRIGDIDDIMNRFNTIDKKLGEAFTEITRNLDKTTKQLSEFHNQVDDNFTEAVRKLQQLVNGLNDSIEDLTDR